MTGLNGPFWMDLPTYEILKLLHILGATILFGTGMGTAFHGLFGYLRGDLATKMVIGRNVVLADWVFTTPAAIFQPITGYLLAQEVGWPVFEGWVMWALILYVVVGVCWLPVVWLQIRIAAMAKEAARSGTELPALAHRYAMAWFALGWPAFTAMIGIFWLMVFKPDL